MSVWAVSGAAGYGKTYRLMQRLEEELASRPLLDDQKVLALTFMHGSRRRLEQRLKSIGVLKQRYTCVTVDGFARHLRERWQRLSTALGQPQASEVDFNLQCELAADVLNRDVALAWASRAYPIVIVDEAQDLDAGRLRIVQALQEHTSLLLAFDDFQCLEANRRPSPAAVWIPTACDVEELQEPKRTDVLELILAATALRSSDEPVSGKRFKVIGCEGVPQAAAVLASQLHWNVKQTVAVITPSKKGGFAEAVVNRVATTACGQRKHGPFRVSWDESEPTSDGWITALGLEDRAKLEDVLRALATLPMGAASSSLHRWAQRQGDVLGRTYIAQNELLERARRHAALHKSHGGRSESGFRAMTVHQAKNREFDGVVVLWPHTLRDDPEGKQRLLYNAVTRAKRWCHVIVQGKARLEAPPFTRQSNAAAGGHTG